MNMLLRYKLTLHVLFIFSVVGILSSVIQILFYSPFIGIVYGFLSGFYFFYLSNNDFQGSLWKILSNTFRQEGGKMLAWLAASSLSYFIAVYATIFSVRFVESIFNIHNYAGDAPFLSWCIGG